MTDNELAEVAAKDILGWKLCRKCKTKTANHVVPLYHAPNNPWPWLAVADMNFAVLVLDAMRAGGWHGSVEWLPLNRPEVLAYATFTVSFWKRLPTTFTESAATPVRAVLLAAAKAARRGKK